MLFAFVSERMNTDRVADWERPDAPPKIRPLYLRTVRQ